MIKAEDLRIGNWVYYKSPVDPRPIKIKTIDSNVQDADENMLEYHCNGYPLDGDIEPIPLTGDILESADFVVAWPYFVKGDLELKYEEEKDFHVYYSGTLIAKHYQYVHQLQNLYFALEGTELEINL